MTAKQYLQDAATRHQIFLNRYAGATWNQLAKFVEQARREAIIQLADAPDNPSRDRLNRLAKELREVTRAIYMDMSKEARKQMTELAAYEADFTKRLLETSTNDNVIEVSVPTVVQLQTAAFTTVMDAAPGYEGTEGLTIAGALSQFGTKKAAELVQTVRLGYATGQSNTDIIKTITQQNRRIARRQAETLTRTIVQHVAAQAREQTYQENADILGNYQVVATLDGRTSNTCKALDGQQFTPQEFNAPPYHYNCRSTYIRVPTVENQADLPSETRPAKGEDNQVQSVNSQSTYNSWLERQPASFQNEVLGPARAALFREGLSVRDFVDDNYQPLNLNQIRAKDNEHIFERAGL